MIAAFTVKGNLDEGILLAESVYKHMTEIAGNMKQYDTDYPRRPGEIRNMPDEYIADQQKYIELEKLYRSITGSQPKFPKVA
jgi:hypothetical protein